MKITPPKAYSEDHLKILYDELPEGSYLKEFIKTSKFNNKELFNLIVKLSHSKKYSSHTKNLIRSLRVVIFTICLTELPLWLNEENLELQAVIKWRLSIVG